ncbi:HEAT repeat domain-containing protein [Psychroserpens sp. SPM9]|uniref:HEAT repeat domain-containing protein n=1 Tax=Psychroserpens sp. SPM9 TaxID=2975598 RepID=UPI0021A6AE72|nr:HEAT repeat domain-containing protein [Psychroserpens sp. SPM9]MDG5490248.1 HEAT repeat domain-containing protein [Psychroserpens sp. SPM9]
MDCKHIEHQIVDYIDRQLSAEDMLIIEQHIASCRHCKAVYDDTKALFSAFENVPEASPSDDLRTGFYNLLEEEKQLLNVKVVSLSKPDKTVPWKQAFQVAASIVLLLGGYFLGSYNSEQTAHQEISELQQETMKLREGMMLAMIENQSPSKRIQAVNFTESFAKPDIKILEALIERMQYDGNMNVRLAAAEALSEFPKSTLVKEAFIEALSTQKDPSLQIAIIQFLVKIQEKRAIAPMQQLLEHEDTPDFVKAQVNSGISEII